MMPLPIYWLLVSWMSLTGVHPFYLSVTDMQYNTDNQEIEIAIKIFTDDLDETLSTRYDQPIRLATEREHKDADAYLFSYLKEVFSLKNGESTLPLSFLGRELEEDVIWCYLTAPCPTPPQTIEVKQSLLLDMFDSQRNIVHLKVGDNIESLLLQKGKPRGMLEF